MLTRPPPMPALADGVAQSASDPSSAAVAAADSLSSLPAWPAPLSLSSDVLATIMRDAGYDDAAVAASAAAADAASRAPGARSRTRHSVQPARLDLWSDTAPRAHSWGIEETIAAAASSSILPSAGAVSPRSSSARTPSPGFGVSTGGGVLPSAIHALNYDLMIGHATHLFRSTLQLERRLELMEAPRAASPASSAPSTTSSFAFVDPFGTRIQVPGQPWQLLSDATTHLVQTYIPAHLQSWCKIGILTTAPAPADSKPIWIDQPDEAESSVLALEGIEPLQDRHMRMTLAHTKLVRREEHTDSSGLLPAAASPTAASGVIKLEPSGSTAPPPAFVAYGELTIVLRNPFAPSSLGRASPVLPSESARPRYYRHSVGSLASRPDPTGDAPTASDRFVSPVGPCRVNVLDSPCAESLKESAPNSSGAIAAPAAAAQVHTFTMQVRGLDLLSAVFQRIVTHAASAFGSSLHHGTMYSARQSFSVPLAHMSPADSDAREVSAQQSIFSAQLAEARRVLIVEVTAIDDDHPRGSPFASPSGVSLALTVRTLDGRTFTIDVRSTATVLELKQAIERSGVASGSDQPSAVSTTHPLPASRQKLVWRKAELDQDRRTLRSYGVQSGDIIALLVKTPEKSASSSTRNGVGDFHLQCGRLGLHPLQSSSPSAVQLVHDVMCWTIPPASKLRQMPRALLVALLLHTRRLLSELYDSICVRQDISGHTSRGRTWVDEPTVRQERQAGVEIVEEVERRVEMIEDADGEVVLLADKKTPSTDGKLPPSSSKIGVKRSPPRPLHRSSPLPLPPLSASSPSPLPVDGSIVDLTDHPLALQFDSSEVVDITPPVAQRRRLSPATPKQS